MKIKIISYGYKFYEELGVMPPKHDFLFNLRDLNNPFWVPELKPYNGKDTEIQEFFLKDPDSQKRLKQIQELASGFVHDFTINPGRQRDDEMVFAFRCTGGKHRSVYFAEQVFKSLVESYASKLALEIEHVDLARHAVV
jgi:UPF0042 nucleotide-binding protein